MELAFTWHIVKSRKHRQLFWALRGRRLKECAADSDAEFLLRVAGQLRPLELASEMESTLTCWFGWTDHLFGCLDFTIEKAVTT